MHPHTLLEEEAQERRTRRIQLRMKEARFRQVKPLSELEAAALPAGISIDQLHELAAGDDIDGSRRCQ